MRRIKPKSVMAAITCNISGFTSIAAAAPGTPCCMACTPSIISGGIICATASAPTTHSAPQISTCTTATDATPSILPSIRSKGLTDETITSSTRLFFSSITDCITIEP